MTVETGRSARLHGCHRLDDERESPWFGSVPSSRRSTARRCVSPTNRRWTALVWVHEPRARRRRPGHPLHAPTRRAERDRQEMAEKVGVSASTIRRRIADIEATGVFGGHHPDIDYEAANFPCGRCSSSPRHRPRKGPSSADCSGPGASYGSGPRGVRGGRPNERPRSQASRANARSPEMDSM